MKPKKNELEQDPKKSNPIEKIQLKKPKTLRLKSSRTENNLKVVGFVSANIMG